MAKDIICPHCKRNLIPSEGFEHDNNLNLLCFFCKGVLFAASKETEVKVKSSLQKVDAAYQVKKECLPIKMQNASVIEIPPQNHCHYDVYGD